MLLNCGTGGDFCEFLGLQGDQNQSILKEISLEYSSEGLMLKLKLQYFSHMMRRANSLEKILMLGKIEEDKGTTEDQMVGWHHRLSGHEFAQTGDSEGQGGLMCCSLWGRKESDMTERLNNHHGVVPAFHLSVFVTSFWSSEKTYNTFSYSCLSVHTRWFENADLCRKHSPIIACTYSFFGLSLALSRVDTVDCWLRWVLCFPTSFRSRLPFVMWVGVCVSAGVPCGALLPAGGLCVCKGVGKGTSDITGVLKVTALHWGLLSHPLRSPAAPFSLPPFSPLLSHTLCT